MFITFEGVEGCGKTLQIERARGYLESRGCTCVLTREPGGTPFGVAVRQVLLKSGGPKREDRQFGDDRAIVGGFALLGGRQIMIIGQQKGRDTKENILRNFGMPHPEGYRKALRLMQLAGKFGRPIVTLIDTPGAFPGVDAEKRGQSEAIARNLREMLRIPVPIVVVVIGEGGSGGALAMALGERVLMFENAIYSVISPEGCAAILWGDRAQAPRAAEALRITARDLDALGVIDRVLEEPKGGAHGDPSAMAGALRQALEEGLGRRAGIPADTLLEDRFQKYLHMGVFADSQVAT